ncbi:unnamed protein product [Prunus armeniaca]
MLVKSKIVKSKTADDHLSLMFGILKRYNMPLNPNKFVFGVSSGKFLGFMNSQVQRRRRHYLMCRCEDEEGHSEPHQTSCNPGSIHTLGYRSMCPFLQSSQRKQTADPLDY